MARHHRVRFVGKRFSLVKEDQPDSESIAANIFTSALFPAKYVPVTEASAGTARRPPTNDETPEIPNVRNSACVRLSNIRRHERRPTSRIRIAKRNWPEICD